MSDTKALEYAIQVCRGYIPEAECDQAAAELAQLKLDASGHYIKGGDGLHWDGCEETHYDCKIAKLEKENAQLRADLAAQTAQAEEGKKWAEEYRIEAAYAHDENAELKETLRFYADEDNWNISLEEPSLLDGGNKARAVLAKETK